MSKRTHKAIFEREQQPADNFGTATSSWCEVAREWVGLPDKQPAPRAEFVDANQTKSVRPAIYACWWTKTVEDAVDSSCRMKLAKPNVVDESEPDSDCNFRIFHIESVVNVGEMNRELQFVVVEQI